MPLVGTSTQAQPQAETQARLLPWTLHVAGVVFFGVVLAFASAVRLAAKFRAG